MLRITCFHPFSWKGIPRHLTAGVAFLLWVGAPILQAGLLLRSPTQGGIGASDRPGESQLVEIPKSERTRKIWLATHGARFGLTADSGVDVVCTCKCCGDRCAMGASCCCSAEKIPVQRPAGGCLLVQGCAPRAAVAPNVSDFKWYLSPELFAAKVFPTPYRFRVNAFPLPTEPDLAPPSPIPKNRIA